MEFSEILTRDQLAEKLQVKLPTLDRWVRLGLIPKIKINDRVVRFHWRRVQEALAKMEVKERMS